MTTHKWQFAPRFRRQAFGWRSDLPIKRVREAVSEISKVARKDPALGAEGAIRLLEKLSPALENVDGSSGSLGAAVNKAIATLAAVIAAADVDARLRQRWLDRLWQALQDDQIPYIEKLGDHWGEMCASPELAAHWADEMLPGLKMSWRRDGGSRMYFTGTSVCLSSMLAAGRHQELLDLLETAPFIWWHYRQWGVQALVEMGRKAEAIRYAEASGGLNDSGLEIARACEAILLSSGMAEEAYQRYALEATRGTTYLATFRAIARKYPGKEPADILRDLVAGTPGQEGKWFAAAKDAGLYEVAIELAERSPTDPRTLARAARDYAEKQPDFALAAGLSALRWIALGYGYEISNADVLNAYSATLLAAGYAGVPASRVDAQVNEILDQVAPGDTWVAEVLRRHPGGR